MGVALRRPAAADSTDTTIRCCWRSSSRRSGACALTCGSGNGRPCLSAVWIGIGSPRFCRRSRACAARICSVARNSASLTRLRCDWCVPASRPSSSGGCCGGRWTYRNDPVDAVDGASNLVERRQRSARHRAAVEPNLETVRRERVCEPGHERLIVSACIRQEEPRHSAHEVTPFYRGAAGPLLPDEFPHYPSLEILDKATQQE